MKGSRGVGRKAGQGRGRAKGLGTRVAESRSARKGLGLGCAPYLECTHYGKTRGAWAGAQTCLPGQRRRSAGPARVPGVSRRALAGGVGRRRRGAGVNRGPRSRHQTDGRGRRPARCGM